MYNYHYSKLSWTHSRDGIQSLKLALKSQQIFIDLKKKQDILDHKNMLHSLQAYGTPEVYKQCSTPEINSLRRQTE
jgi:hypothetical protein